MSSRAVVSLAPGSAYVVVLLQWLVTCLIVRPLKLLWRFVLKPFHQFVLRPFYDFVLVPLNRLLLQPLWRYTVVPCWRLLLRPMLSSVHTRALRPVFRLVRDLLNALARLIDRFLSKVEEVIRHTSRFVQRRFGPAFKQMWVRAARPVLRALYRYVLRPAVRLVWRLLKLVWKAVRFLTSPMWTLMRRAYTKWTRKGFTQGQFTLGIHPGKLLEGADGDNMYVMKDQQQYCVYLRNADPYRQANCTLSIDGKEVGTFRLAPNSYYYVERPVDQEKRFTFFLETTKPDKTGITPGKSTNGLVEAKFVPQLVYQGLRRRAQSVSQTTSLECRSLDDFKEECDLAYECAPPPSMMQRQRKNSARRPFAAGATALTGASQQTFGETDAILEHEAATVAIGLRLVGAQ